MQKENVWNYPRPAICEAFSGALRVTHKQLTVASTTRAFRTLETSHPPTYYFPPEDIERVLLVKSPHQTYCEWKGQASYFDLHIDGDIIERAAWTYSSPTTSFSAITNYVSFYASKVEDCFVNSEKVIAQAGDFYGGWITRNIEGPFKGGPGTGGW